MQPRLPHALFTQMARNARVETTVSDGPTRMGYVGDLDSVVVSSLAHVWLSFAVTAERKANDNDPSSTS